MTTKLAYSEMKVLVTGASSGIGKGTVLYLAEKGVAAICLFARRPEPLDELAAELKESYPNVQTLVVAGDASSADDNKRAVDAAVAAFGGLTGAFINAGVYQGGMPLVDTPDAVVDEVINVYVHVWFLCYHFRVRVLLYLFMCRSYEMHCDAVNFVITIFCFLLTWGFALLFYCLFVISAT
jgi:NAD(P)-dependent dehydrogenase (short-subunit alcohol dehydrogenase family)